MRASPVPPPVWMLIFGAVMWALDRYVPLFTLVPAPWNRLAWGVTAIAVVAPVAALLQFKRADTTVNSHEPETTSALVTSGVYGWTRNPMYLGLSILLLAWAIGLGSLSALLGPIVFVPFMSRVQIRAEEEALRIRFGEEFDRYCRRVNRWIGRSTRQR